MKIIVIILLVLLAVGRFVIGILAGSDPEGRGGEVTVMAWLVALVSIIGAVAAGVLL